MTTPAHKLQKELIPGCVMTLRSADGVAQGNITYVDAMWRASRGLIEGVGPGSGKIKYLRELKPGAVEDNPHVDQQERVERQKPQPLNAQTNIGAYRQDLNGNWCWALCLCRGFDGARA